LEVHWSGPKEDRDLVVGYLEFDGSQWSFRYPEDMDEAERLGFPGFRGIPSPDELPAGFSSPNLFPAFSTRIPSLNRPDVLRAAGDITWLNREEAFYEFLRRTGGRTGTDQLSFVAVSKGSVRTSDGLTKALRNEIRKMVGALRGLLVDDIRLQLEGTFRILPTGEMLDAESVDTARLLDRQAVESAIRYEMAAGRTSGEAVEIFTREAAFTYLNRLAALKLMEARGLIQESISNGPDSSGFRLFKLVCEEVCATQVDGGYRRYIELLFDDAASEVRVLFDRSLPHSRIFPRPATLSQVLQILNHSVPADVWRSDETIGWIYQYFTPKEDRKALRDTSRGGSPVPRNSYELAVRNQFYTPRYVVQFLTDNTLGRLWYDMRTGHSRIGATCSHLLRRPIERFLGPGESLPATPNITQQSEIPPLDIPHRDLKDPRDLFVLDPACGSGHFLLYAFDLLLVIYEEAWIGSDTPACLDTGRTLREDYPDQQQFRRLVPGLILRYNLHGVDIDPRAAQIASLALWLRVQRAYQELNLKPKERLRIRRSNIVCAEPMPGDQALLDEFLGNLQPPVLRQLVTVVFKKMELAGEAGSLLKIEEEIADAIAEARRQWAGGAQAEQVLLWPEARRPAPVQGTLFDTTGVTEEAFWHQAEDRVLEELSRYARHIEDGRGIVRYLFAEDASQGFAFIDLCRKRFDVVLMNPPFGEFSKAYKALARDAYPNTYNDIFAAFTERFLDRLHDNGLLGAITSRTGFFLTTFSAWREKVLLRKASLTCLADLGGEVMDEAMVEAAAYCLSKSKSTSPAAFLRLLGLADREGELQTAANAMARGRRTSTLIFASQQQFEILPEKPFVYWVPASATAQLSSHPPFEPNAGHVRQGLVTSDNPRFVRTIWEIPCGTLETEGHLNAKRIGNSNSWVPLVMAGASQPWYSPIGVVLKWKNNGSELREFVRKWGAPSRRIASEDFYFFPGFSWTLRAVRFIPYCVPRGCIFTASRYMAFPKERLEFSALGVTASNVATAFMRFYGEWFTRPKFLVETLKALPWPSLPEEIAAKLEAHVVQEVERRRKAYQRHEPFHEFIAPALLTPDNSDSALAFDMDSLLGPDLEELVAHAYGLSIEDEKALQRDLKEAIQARRAPPADDVEEGEEDEEPRDAVITVDAASELQALLSYAVGCSFGRWDLRIGRDPSLAPKLPGPFDPLPVCPPGMLVGTDGLPAVSGRIVSEEWLRARQDARSLPVHGTVQHSTIPDDEYPLPQVPWDGILVDDEGHPSDIVGRVREVLRLLFPERADAAERDACESLEVKNLRAYFRNPRKFFDDHVKQYSKSPRKAPIYWLLQSGKRSYGLWVYCHRLTRDSLFHAMQSYVEPKLQHEEGRRHELRRLYEAARSAKNVSEERKLARDMDVQESLVGEISEFKANLEAAALGRLPRAEPGCGGWDPNLDDGIILTIAPLHVVVPWKDATKAWGELADGRYDWSHVALRYWPNRVREKCLLDRSLRIAHGLEEA